MTTSPHTPDPRGPDDDGPPPKSEHWSDLTDDPMDPPAIEARQAGLRAARRPPVEDRPEYLVELGRGRRVLDLGVVDHTSRSDRRTQWLHGQLAGSARECLGVDVIPSEVDRLVEEGFDVRCMDLTAGERPEGEWDVIVAGELIEHLDRPGELFRAVAELLAPNGVFVLTSPNPYAAWRVFQQLRDRPSDNVDHALLLNPWGIAELADRWGLRLHSFRGIRARPTGPKARLLDAVVRRRLLPVVPEATCESMLYEVVHTRS